jgi:hypothetical protein
MLIERSVSKTTLHDDRSTKGWAAVAQISERNECFWRGKVFSGSIDPKVNHRLFRLIPVLVAITLIWQ